MNKRKAIVLGIIVVAIVAAVGLAYWTGQEDEGYDLALALEEKYGFVDVVGMFQKVRDPEWSDETFLAIVILPLQQVEEEPFMNMTIDAINGLYNYRSETDGKLVVVVVDGTGRALAELDCDVRQYSTQEELNEYCIPYKLNADIVLDMPWLGRKPWQ
jgi:hypothetical protein